MKNIPSLKVLINCKAIYQHNLEPYNDFVELFLSQNMRRDWVVFILAHNSIDDKISWIII